MPAALTVVRSLFAVATQGATGIFRIERAGVFSRLELEQGYVHAMSNVGRSPRGEETLLQFLAALPDEAQPGFDARAPRAPLVGNPVPAFHPARTVRRHIEAHAWARPGLPPSDDARVRLGFRPHSSCVDGTEAVVVGLLDSPRRFGDLCAAVPRIIVERLTRFLEAAGAVTISDPAVDDAWAALGLPPGAPAEQIKSAWRQLARELHPDLHPEGDALTTARFQRALDAYRRLLG